MKELHAAACGRTDEDRMAKRKEEVSPSCGIVVHLSRATWLHMSSSRYLSEMDVPDLSR